MEDRDITDIKQLISHFPYYRLPYIVLAKIYFEKEHYLFENALTQAAMRVTDREWLYHYINGGQNTAFPSMFPEETIPEIKVETMEAPVEIAIPEAVPVQEITESAEFKVPEKEPEPVIIVKDTLNESMVETSGIVEPVESASSGNHLSEFLEEGNVQSPSEEENENIEKLSEEPVISRAEFENAPITEEEVNENIAETIKQEESEESKPELDTAIHLAMNLRKHPVYNVEEFLQGGDRVEKGDTEVEKDFFYWLQHPKHTPSEDPVRTEEPEENDENTGKDQRFNIIDQFIKANPAISRPKKEFFNAENMAKKSELLDSDFVTETLANIYYEQGNTDLAVKAYEKLSLQNPLKQAYFANLIEKIKKEKK